MLVGFMQRSKKPSKIAKVTALMCSHYGIELIYFSPYEINMEDGQVKGKIFKDNKWVAVTRELPPIVDATSKCFKSDTKKIMAYLRENTILTFDKKNTPNKEKLQSELLKDSEFKHLVIPTKSLDSFETLEQFLNEHSAIIMKPLFGNRGRGLYSLRKQNNHYLIGHLEEEKKLNHEELRNFYTEFLTEKKYIIQKLIESRTTKGDPFDCRIQIQKGRDGNWVIAKIFVRIGIGQKVMSNVHQGGGISEPKPFLKANFKHQWEDIYQRLKELALTLPYKIEEIKKTPTMDLGFDVGIEKDGELYLFESNNGATKKPLISESAMLRVQYYQYIRDTYPQLKKGSKEKGNKTEVKFLENKITECEYKNKELVQERNLYKKKWSQIKQSKSWRLTRPIRKLSSVLKK